MLENVKVCLLTFPLVFVLLSLAIMPILCERFWKKYEVLILFGVSILSITESFLLLDSTKTILYHSLVQDYIPFIVMLFTLYTLSNGINIQITVPPTPLNNVLYIMCCGLFSSIIGTTGASMLFLKPFLSINQERKHKSHLIVFFIFIVSNIGGVLTPLGDPPLLLGYLYGVDFFWCAKNLSVEWAVYMVSCAVILLVIDHIKFKKENIQIENTFFIKIKGINNIVFLLITVFVLFINIGDTVGDNIPVIFLKNIILLGLCGISLCHKKKKMDFKAFKEVAITFLVIFTVIAPVIFLLENNVDTIKKCIFDLGSNVLPSTIYFWMCGIASSFLDNAPSYLLFFNMAGGNAQELMTVFPELLKAISLSAVVMGSITYIGNAPNMMVRSIAVSQGVKMPSFVGYMCWSLCIILPLSIIITMII